jgi:hypothetical protein
VNDLKSPLFLSKSTTGENLKQVKFDDKRVIKTIHGDAKACFMKKISFKDKKNNEILKIEA